jgi:hypothetical protein
MEGITNMSKKLLIGLAPLLVTASIAVMPAVAQAAPHYYKNLALLEEGTKLPYISWGTLSLSSAAGSVECENAVAGYVENPTGGGAGKENDEAFDAYNCKSEACEGAGGKIGVIFENENEPGPVVQINWPGELTEAVKGTIRLNSTNVRVFVRCQFAHIPPIEEEVKSGPLTGLTQRTTVEFIAPGASACTTEPGKGNSQPKTENGSSTGKPGKTAFGAGSGELECGAAAGKGKTEGKLKTMGYNESELLSTKNP